MSRLQSGIPKGKRDNTTGRRANGMLLRGIVVETYVVDDPGHPQALAPTDQSAAAVYCDVLIYSSLGGNRWLGLKNVLVTQEISGLHRGKIWKPRPARIDFVDNMQIEEGSNPAFLDGDHVLVGFMNDNLDQPIILRSLPHPSRDIGNELAELGRRTKLQLADGDPDISKHHGVHWGIDDEGNALLNTNFAYDGTIDADGKEPPPTGDPANGNVSVDIPLESTVTVQINDMTDPDNPDPQVIMTLSKDQKLIDIKDAAGEWKLKIEDGDTLSLTGKDADANLTLGDGAKHAAIVETLETLWGNLVTWLNTHTHPTGTGPSGPPSTSAPSWDSNINSTKVSFPDG